MLALYLDRTSLWYCGRKAGLLFVSDVRERQIEGRSTYCL